jgi:CheY-like chemotaxis protein
MEMLTPELNQQSRGPAVVLVVDDSKIVHLLVRNALAAGLTGAGYSVISAMDAAEGLKVVASEAPDIIVTDAMMPGMSGFDLIRKIKSQPETACIPVILLTCLEAENGSVMDASGKADLCLGKPFNDADIRSRIQKAELMIHEWRVMKRVQSQPGA